MSFITFLMFLPCYLLACIGQPEYYVLQKLIIIDQRNTEVSLLGTTNVNNFTCKYSALLPQDTFMVTFNKAENRLYTSDIFLPLSVFEFTCENTRMTEDFRDLLKAEKYPSIQIDLNKFYRNNSSINVAEVAISIAGIRNNYLIEAAVKKYGNRYISSGQTEICITDFGLVAPEKFFGMVKVNETIWVKFDLAFTVLDR